MSRADDSHARSAIYDIKEEDPMRRNDIQDTRKNTKNANKNAASERWILERKKALNFNDKQRFTIMFGSVMPM